MLQLVPPPDLERHVTTADALGLIKCDDSVTDASLERHLQHAVDCPRCRQLLEVVAEVVVARVEMVS
jgi:hypothetical protein